MQRVTGVGWVFGAKIADGMPMKKGLVTWGSVGQLNDNELEGWRGDSTPRRKALVTIVAFVRANNFIRGDSTPRRKALVTNFAFNRTKIPCPAGVIAPHAERHW